MPCSVTCMWHFTFMFSCSIVFRIVKALNTCRKRRNKYGNNSVFIGKDRLYLLRHEKRRAYFQLWSICKDTLKRKTNGWYWKSIFFTIKQTTISLDGKGSTKYKQFIRPLFLSLFLWWLMILNDFKKKGDASQFGCIFYICSGHIDAVSKSSKLYL